MKKLQDILRNAECDWTLDGQRMDDTEIDEAINQAAQAIEKDILELIGWEDNYRLYLVADTKKPVEDNLAQAINILRARNLLRSELRLKLKEYLKP
jgi:hypothetical protein